MLKAQAAPRKNTMPVEVVCWRCGEKGHRRDDCTETVWYSFCKSKRRAQRRSVNGAPGVHVSKMAATAVVVKRIVNQIAHGELREEKTTPSGHTQKMPAFQVNSCRSKERD